MFLPQVHVVRQLSRMQGSEPGAITIGEGRVDEWGDEQASGIWITGRHVLNLWRLMRSELKLTSFTLQNVTAHVLNKRFPALRHRDLTQWFASGPADRGQALMYAIRRSRLNLDIVDKLDLIGRTSEMARWEVR
jgi:DNA polymerase zeta